MLLPAFWFDFLILEGWADSVSRNVVTGLLLYAV